MLINMNVCRYMIGCMHKFVLEYFVYIYIPCFWFEFVYVCCVYVFAWMYIVSMSTLAAIAGGIEKIAVV